MRKYIAEFLGTAILVLIGCGSAVGANAMFSAMGLLPAAFTTLSTAVAFGLTLLVVICIFGRYSGAHVNPAVSLAMLISKKMTVRDFFGYVIAQLAGGTAAAALLSVIMGGTTSLFANGYDSESTFGTSMEMALLIEIVLTFIFVTAVLSVKKEDENITVTAAVSGAALALVSLFGIPFTGTSVNPARSLGPALFQGDEAISQVWVFIVAPLVGAILAALLDLFMKREPKKRKWRRTGKVNESAEDDAADLSSEQEADSESLCEKQEDETVQEEGDLSEADFRSESEEAEEGAEQEEQSPLATAEGEAAETKAEIKEDEHLR
ncbi:MAG: aquaporin [Anaerovoracaceae bacterium]